MNFHLKDKPFLCRFLRTNVKIVKILTKWQLHLVFVCKGRLIKHKIKRAGHILEKIML